MSTEGNIKNADFPVTPLVNDNGHPFHVSQVCFGNTPLTIGLTKREHFAGLAMQGYMSGQFAWGSGDGGSCSPTPEEAAGEAVLFADALLKELEK